MEVLEDKENFLFNRREIKLIAKAEKNPNYEEALNLIAEEFKADKELIVIKGIKGKFGRNTFLITSFIYKSKEDKEGFEKKKEKAKEQKGGEQPQQPATEKPAQEQKPKEEK